MNTEQLRQSLRDKWLRYYEENHEWLTRLAVWVDCEGQRRPSSGFILATLSVLEPNLSQLLPLIVDLSNNPDRIILALGLNFNPDEAVKKLEADTVSPVKMLPASAAKKADLPETKGRARVYSEMDEACQGARGGETRETKRPQRK